MIYTTNLSFVTGKHSSKETYFWTYWVLRYEVSQDWKWLARESEMRQKRWDKYEFSDFDCYILDSLRGDGKVTNTYEKTPLSIYEYSFDLQPPWTKTIFFLYALMCHKIKKLSNRLMNHFPNFWVKIPKFDNYQPPIVCYYRI